VTRPAVGGMELSAFLGNCLIRSMEPSRTDLKVKSNMYVCQSPYQSCRHMGDESNYSSTSFRVFYLFILDFNQNLRNKSEHFLNLTLCYRKKLIDAKIEF
jgi:hypothetical protein